MRSKNATNSFLPRQNCEPNRRELLHARNLALSGTSFTSTFLNLHGVVISRLTGPQAATSRHYSSPAMEGGGVGGAFLGASAADSAAA